MYNLDEIVKIYYSSVSTYSILSGGVKYKEFPEHDFQMLSKDYLHQYSDTEDVQLYRYLKESVDKEGHPFYGLKGRSGLNVFAALEELAEQLLTMENNRPICIYKNLLRFRSVTQQVDEDLLVCAYLAMRYKQYRKPCMDFAWNVAIEHNNDQLHAIMERGISENHFHLYGSAPTFYLIWIELMNHVSPGDEIATLSEKLEESQRVTRRHYSIQYKEDSFTARIIKAALIRVCLVRYCIDDELDEAKLSWVKQVLLREVNVEADCNKIQKHIDIMKSYGLIASGCEESDYALYNVPYAVSMEAEHSWVGGERWLMYEMLKRELTGNSPEYYFQWFYAYLVIKHSIRSELIQVNETVGFANFSIYSGRKRGVYNNSAKMIESAVYGSVESGNIQSLEIRIVPARSAEENARNITNIDNVIQSRKNGRLPRTAYYFVFHFTKCEDKAFLDEDCFSGHYCRHYAKRRSLEEEANAIYRFREQYREIASNVLGIDACSMEIGCRPEVFAVVFRFLSEHVVPDIWGVEPVGQLKMTYHVGEDFLDVVDGLRAVDEAIRFLNLQCGDRIGHGTVLGIDVKKWYKFKDNTILITQQDYLDNVVWLYHKLLEYRIEGMEALSSILLEQFDFYFSRIYGSVAGQHVCKSIYTYYEAWKLRGDEPQLYTSKGYQKDEEYGAAWLVNQKYPEEFSVRERKDVCQLYYMYHYDLRVRKEGSHSIQKYLLPMYVEGVAAVQKAMQREVSARGIGIEANPSSNLAISTIQSYEEHPIVQMYNKDLTWDVEKLSACSQINVSINTDDKGIFHTSLENEYALMACALEKVRDDKGNKVYNRQMIYQWIDNIREMGNMQSFRRQSIPQIASSHVGFENAREI